MLTVVLRFKMFRCSLRHLSNDEYVILVVVDSKVRVYCCGSIIEDYVCIYELFRVIDRIMTWYKYEDVAKILIFFGYIALQVLYYTEVIKYNGVLKSE